MSSGAPRATKTMVVVGPRGAGKATLVGNLMYKCGGVDMVLLEKMQKAGVDKYDQVIKFCKEHDIKPFFEAKDSVVFLMEEAMATDRPDCLIYMIDALAEPAAINLPKAHAEAAKTVFVINKM